MLKTPLSERAWYPGYVLGIIGLVSIANYYDRNLITILVEPMKRDLHLSDADIGLLTGIGFALRVHRAGAEYLELDVGKFGPDHGRE